MITLMALAIFSAAQPTTSVDAFLDKFAQKRKGLIALKAEFTQDNRHAGESDIAKGAIFYASPRRIIFRYPESELTYVFDEMRVYEYDASLEQVQIHDLEEDPQTEALFLGFGEDVGRLKKAYDIELFTPDKAECGTSGLILRPKTAPQKERAFKEVRLYLEGENSLPCRVQIVNDEDSIVLINISNYVVNPPFKAEDTQMKAAPGTDVFRNDQPWMKAGPEGMLIPDTPIQPPAPAVGTQPPAAPAAPGVAKP